MQLHMYSTSCYEDLSFYGICNTQNARDYKHKIQATKTCLVCFLSCSRRFDIFVLFCNSRFCRQVGIMILQEKLEVNPSDCNERWDNLKFIMDDIVLPGLNSNDAPVELQIAMIPIGSLKERLSSATKSLDKAVSRYMRMRTELVVEGSTVPPTEMDSVRLLQKVMGEVRVLYDAYDLYADQIKSVRASVMRQLDLYINNARLISLELEDLLLSDRQECMLRSYGIELSMKEYQALEEQIDASLKSTLEVILSALKYFMDIIDRCSDAYENLADTFEDDVNSDYED